MTPIREAVAGAFNRHLNQCGPDEPSGCEPVAFPADGFEVIKYDENPGRLSPSGALIRHHDGEGYITYLLAIVIGDELVGLAYWGDDSESFTTVEV